MQIISVSIDFTKVSKEDLQKEKYLNLIVTINDQKDKFNNDGSVTLSQTKEEREAKTPKKYVGNAKVIFRKITIKTNSNGRFKTTKETNTLPMEGSKFQ